MLDLAHGLRREAIDNTPREREAFGVPSLDEKRRRALSYLGRRWVLHPEYRPDPRHNPKNRAALLQ